MPINYNAPIEIRDLRNGSWFWIHTHVWRDTTLTQSDKVVYGTLASYSNQKQTSFPSIDRISKDSGISDRHVYRCLKNLEGLGYITVKRRNGKPNIYTLVKTTPDNMTPDMKSPLTGSQETPDKYTPRTISNNKNKSISDNTPKGVNRCPLKDREKFPMLVRKYPGGHKECVEYISSAGKFPNFGKQIRHLHNILKAGYDFEDITKAIERLEADSFWSKKGWDFGILSNEISKVRPEHG